MKESLGQMEEGKHTLPDFAEKPPELPNYAHACMHGATQNNFQLGLPRISGEKTYIYISPNRLYKAPTDYTKPQEHYTKPQDYAKPQKRPQSIRQRLKILNKSSNKYYDPIDNTI